MPAGAWGNDRASFSGNVATTPYFAANEFPTSLPLNPSGFIGGVQVGYNWLVAPRFLVGVEADFQGSGYRGERDGHSDADGPLCPVHNIGRRAQQLVWYTPTQGRILRCRISCSTEPADLRTDRSRRVSVRSPPDLRWRPVRHVTAAPRDHLQAYARAGPQAPAWNGCSCPIGRSRPNICLSISYLSATGTSCCGTFTANTPFRENIARAGVNWYFEPPIARSLPNQLPVSLIHTPTPAALVVGRAKLSGILTCTSQPLRQQKKKEACIGKPPSLAKSEVVRLTHQFGGRGLQARVRRVDVAPVDFARARLVQFATESAVETFCLLKSRTQSPRR